MLVFAREVFVSKCSTDVPRLDPNAGDMAKKLQFKKGTEADFERVPAEHHAAEDLANFKARLDRGEHWMVGEVDGEIVTYTWLHARDRAVYPSLPGCEILMGPSCGYGYDAWTPPELRGQGLRRSAFLEELHILKEVFGCGWEASFFVKHQLEGATRSLGKVGIEIIPTWRVTLNRQKTLDAECLIDDDVARPAWLEQS